MRKILLISIFFLHTIPVAARETDMEVTASGSVLIFSEKTNDGQPKSFAITPNATRIVRLRLEATNSVCAAELQNSRLFNYRKFARFPITLEVAGYAGDSFKLAFYPTRSALIAGSDCEFTLTIE